MLSAPDLVSSLTKGMMEAATQILEKFTHPPPVDDVTDAAIQEHFQQRRLQEWNLPSAGSPHSTDLDTGHKLPRRRRNGNQGLKWLPGKLIGDVNPAIQPAQSPLIPPARRGGASLGLEMRENPIKAVRRMKARVAKYKSGLTGPLQVSRNPLPSRIHDTHLLNPTHPGLAKTNNLE